MRDVLEWVGIAAGSMMLGVGYWILSSVPDSLFDSIDRWFNGAFRPVGLLIGLMVLSMPVFAAKGLAQMFGVSFFE